MTETAPQLTIIVPTRNEVANIEPLLQRLALALLEVDFGVLFVDDSTDNTADVIKETAVTVDFPVELIARPPAQRNGLSGAVVAGFQAASGEWLCVMDADLQHPPEVVPLLLARAREANADIVVGSRKAEWYGPRGLSRKRALTSQMLTLLARMWFPRLLKNVSDPLTGLFLVRRTAVDVDVLQPEGFKILLELLIRCPGLRVSELHFDFAGRNDGESKADFREGMRFFRHLTKLRLTANQSFPRLITVAGGSVLLDTAVFVMLTQMIGWPYWLTAVLSAELFVLLRFLITERWVLGGGHPVPGWPTFSRFFMTNQLSLFLVRLPLLAVFFSWWGLPLSLSALAAIIIEGVVRYILSEQWVFSFRGMAMGQLSLYRYDIHGLLGIESQVRLPELAYFETAVSPEHVDILVRLDRHGTPSPQPGAITYHERLSRFGFGVAIMPGDYTEVVVSPALEKAPYALYKSILEPVLRWTLLRKEAVLVYGGCVAQNGRAALIVPAEDAGKTEMVLQATENGYAFLSDDFTILAADGRVFSFPKPITMTSDVGHDAPKLAWRNRLAARLRTIFYSTASRNLGLQMSRKHWPTATFNIYLQRLVNPPKLDVASFDMNVANSARLTAVVQLNAGQDEFRSLTRAEMVQFVQKRTQAAQGFPPYALLNEALGHWQNQDWHEVENTLIEQALRNCSAAQVSSESNRWWQVWQTGETAVSAIDAVQYKGRMAGNP